jgi:hypothetical protein
MLADIGHELIKLSALDQRENVSERVKFKRPHLRSCCCRRHRLLCRYAQNRRPRPIWGDFKRPDDVLALVPTVEEGTFKRVRRRRGVAREVLHVALLRRGLKESRSHERSVARPAKEVTPARPLPSAGRGPSALFVEDDPDIRSLTAPAARAPNNATMHKPQCRLDKAAASGKMPERSDFNLPRITTWPAASTLCT